MRLRPTLSATMNRMGKRYTPEEQRSAALLAHQIGVEPAAARLHTSPTTVRKWRNQHLAASPATPEPTVTALTPAEVTSAQVPQALSPPDAVQYPQKPHAVRLMSAIQGIYGQKLLELAQDCTSVELATKAFTAASRELRELTEAGKPTINEQHLHTGPEYHAGPSYASRHPRNRKRRQS